MAFKLRSPLENKPNEFGSVPIAASSKGYAGYQSMLKDRLRSTAPENRVGGSGGGTQSTGTFPDPQTGKERYYDKAHQSYSSKTGLVNKTGNFKDGVYNLNKPETKAKSNLPAGQGGSPMAYRGSGTFNSSKTNIKAADLMGQGPVAKGFKAIAGIDTPKSSSFPSKITSTTGGASNLDFSKGNIIGQYDKGKSKPTSPSKPADDGVMLTDAGTNTKPKNKVNPSSNTTKSSNPTTTPSTGSNDNVDKSGGYLKDTKNFSFGVDTKLNVAPMPKFERTVTNARSADYDMIRAKGRGKIDRLKTRLDKREGRVANRVEASSMRIKSRQQRSGERYASKMEARTNTGTNEKSMDSPKPTAASSKSKASTPKGNKVMQNQSTKVEKSSLGIDKNYKAPKATAYKKPSANLPKNPGITSGSISPGPSVNVLKSGSASLNPAKTKSKPSMKLNTSTQTTGFIDDSKIKKGAKQAKGGKKVKASTYESLTGFKNKKGSSDGMRRGMSSANTSIKVPNLSRGPKA